MSLESRWRLLAASYLDDPRGRDAAVRFGPAHRGALDLLVFALANDAAQIPQELDREHVGALVGSILPGRLEGDEPYRGDLPDVLADFLAFVSDAESVQSAWEWSAAIDGARPAYAAALRDPKRARFAADVKREPDRRQGAKLGRNDPCFCGSGKKYKHCCFKLL